MSHPVSQTTQTNQPSPIALIASAAGTNNSPAPAAMQAKQVSPPAPSIFAKTEMEIGVAEKLVINLDKELITSVISKSSQMTGNLKSSEGYRIDGSVEGDVTSDTTVLISEGAMVVGKVRAARVIVLGTIDGGIECNGQLILAKSAVINGEIEYKDIITYQGSTIEGTLRRIGR